MKSSLAFSLFCCSTLCAAGPNEKEVEALAKSLAPAFRPPAKFADIAQVVACIFATRQVNRERFVPIRLTYCVQPRNGS